MRNIELSFRFSFSDETYRETDSSTTHYGKIAHNFRKAKKRERFFQEKAKARRVMPVFWIKEYKNG